MSDDATNLPNSGSQHQVIDYREVGSTGLRRFSGFIYDEFLQELTGWKGIAIYKEMWKNDATVASTMYAIQMLLRQVNWWVDAGGNEPEDAEAAAFLKTCMDDMSQTWADTVGEILTFLVYGHSLHEIVYKRRCGDSLDPSMRSKYIDGRIGWRKMPIRSQDTLYRWQFDENGGIQGAIQIAPPRYISTFLPVEKTLLFRTTTEKNNPEGQSLLRGAFRAWYMKKNIENIEAIGVERDLAGLPVMWVPPQILSPNASDQEKSLAAALREVVVNIRRNSQEGIMLPLDYGPEGKPLYDLKLLSSGGSRQFNTSEIINRWDQRIAMTMLADFLFIGQQSVGSFALVSSRTNLFSTALLSILDIVADIFNRYAVPRLFALNDFQLSDYPKLKHGDVGSVDLKELGDYISKLAGSGMPLFPDNDLEKYLLKAARVPSSAKSEESAGSTSPLVDATSAGTREQKEIPADQPVVDPMAGSKVDTTPASTPKPQAMVATNVSGDKDREAQRMVGAKA